MEFPYFLYLLSTYILYSFIFSSLRINATTEIDQYVIKYGNDVNSSGIWERARELALDELALKRVSLQAHRTIWPIRPIEIKKAYVDTRNLTFPGTQYKDIYADMIIYHIEAPPSYSVFTKGLEPDCVFMCWKVGRGHPLVFELKNHTCDISALLVYNETTTQPDYDY